MLGTAPGLTRTRTELRGKLRDRAGPSAGGRRTIALKAAGAVPEIGLAVLAEAAQHLADRRPLAVLTPEGGGRRHADLALCCRQMGADRFVRLSVMLRDVAEGTVLWARGFDAATTTFGAMVEAIAEALTSSTEDLWDRP